MKIKRFTREPGAPFRLRDFDPDDTSPFRSKADGLALLPGYLTRLAEKQEMLAAQAKRSMLIVLQAIDAGGKDGTIKHVMGAFNPQGVRVRSFKAPNEVERAHDFLWRIHTHAPRKGLIAIFNRSHYEDVLIVRVKQLEPKSAWRKRYAQINDFERLLVESGTEVVKIFLAISREEQAKRLRERLADPTKHWKFDPADLEERSRWDLYQDAFEDMLTRCNTPHAPWFVVPSNKKWFRNVAVSEILLTHLKRMGLAYPPPPPGIENYHVPD